MDKKKLLEYLEMVLDLEKHKFLQECLESAISERIRALSVPNVKEPEKQTVSYPAEPDGFLKFFWTFAVGIGVFAVPIFGLLSLITGASFFLLMLFFVVLITICSCYCAAKQDEDYRQRVNRYYEEQRRSEEAYQKEMRKFREDQERRKGLERIWNQVLSEVSDRLAVTRKLLKIAYDQGVISKKYQDQGLPAVASIYEYLSVGRCHTLERDGSDEGAYNILERETRADIIILQLERVLQNLEKIRENQYTLHSILRDNNHKLDKLMLSSDRTVRHLSALQASNTLQSEKIEETKEASEMAAYHSRRIQMELSHMKRLGLVR